MSKGKIKPLHTSKLNYKEKQAEWSHNDGELKLKAIPHCGWKWTGEVKVNKIGNKLMEKSLNWIKTR